jgi:hypothetical protein
MQAIHVTPFILVLEDVLTVTRSSKTFLTVTRSSKHNFDLFFIKNIYSKMIYLYFYENIFQDSSIYMIFTFSNSIT